jgi:hypothetical protein
MHGHPYPGHLDDKVVHARTQMRGSPSGVLAKVRVSEGS